MKKPTVIIANICSLFFLLLTVDFFTVLMRFLTIGEIPGTSLSVSPDGMFALFAVIAMLVLLRSISTTVSKKTIKQIKTSHQLPKRRYTRV